MTYLKHLLCYILLCSKKEKKKVAFIFQKRKIQGKKDVLFHSNISMSPIKHTSNKIFTGLIKSLFLDSARYAIILAAVSERLKAGGLITCLLLIKNA